MEFVAKCKVERRANKEGKEYTVIVIRVADYQFEKFLTNEQAWILGKLTERKEG